MRRRVIAKKKKEKNIFKVHNNLWILLMHIHIYRHNKVRYAIYVHQCII